MHGYSQICNQPYSSKKHLPNPEKIQLLLHVYQYSLLICAPEKIFFFYPNMVNNVCERFSQHFSHGDQRGRIIMPLWPNTLSIGADDVGFHSTSGKSIANVENTSGSRFLFNLNCFF